MVLSVLIFFLILVMWVVLGWILGLMVIDLVVLRLKCFLKYWYVLWKMMKGLVLYGVSLVVMFVLSVVRLVFVWVVFLE